MVENINSADKSFGGGSVLLGPIPPVDSQHPALPPAAGCNLVWEYVRNAGPFCLACDRLLFAAARVCLVCVTSCRLGSG